MFDVGHQRGMDWSRIGVTGDSCTVSDFEGLLDRVSAPCTGGQHCWVVFLGIYDMEWDDSLDLFLTEFPLGYPLLVSLKVMMLIDGVRIYPLPLV